MTRRCALLGDQLPDWHWRVIVDIEERDLKWVTGAMAPTRAAAKQDVQRRAKVGGATITGWRETYIPRASWDCPVCGVHEGMTKQPNMRGDHDWECMNCFSKAWGEPLEFDRIEDNRPDYMRHDTANQ